MQNEMKSRTPMQWSKEVNAGFTKGTPWLPVNSDYIQTNVDVSVLSTNYRGLH